MVEVIFVTDVHAFSRIWGHAQRLNTLRNWLKRRRQKGVEPNADEVWDRVRRNWPEITEAEAEALFQGAP